MSAPLMRASRCSAASRTPRWRSCRQRSPGRRGDDTIGAALNANAGVNGLLALGADKNLKGLGFLLQGAWARSVSETTTRRRHRVQPAGDAVRRQGPPVHLQGRHVSRPRSPSGTRRTSRPACPSFLGEAGLGTGRPGRQHRRGRHRDRLRRRLLRRRHRHPGRRQERRRGVPRLAYRTSRRAAIEAGRGPGRPPSGTSTPSWPPPRSARPGRARWKARCSSSSTRSWRGQPNWTRPPWRRSARPRSWPGSARSRRRPAGREAERSRAAALRGSPGR